MARPRQLTAPTDGQPLGETLGPARPVNSIRLDVKPGSAGRAQHQGGLVVVHKTMIDPDAFAGQVRWLTRARNLPVAKLCHVDSTTLTYTTRFEGGHTLTTAARCPASGRLHLHRLAVLVAELHAKGLPHGNLEPGHVIVDGRRLTVISPGSSAVDIGKGRRDDVAGFAALMADLAELWSVFDRAEPAVLDQWRHAIEHLVGLRLRNAGRLPDIVGALPTGRRRRLPVVRSTPEMGSL